MGVFVFQAEDGIRDAHWGLEFRRVLFRSRAVIWAVRRTPMVNAAWVDGEDGAQIRLHHYVNLGIAAATPRGLLVPNIKDAQDLSMREPIGRASCRDRVCQYVSISVVAVSLKKTQHQLTLLDINNKQH